MTETTTPARKTPAKKAPAKKAPAKKAPAKAPAKAAPSTAGPKMRWQIEKVYEGQGKDQTARVGDRVYAIRKAGDGWKATVTVDGGKPEVLSDGKFGACYNACTKHNKEGGQAAAGSAA